MQDPGLSETKNSMFLNNLHLHASRLITPPCHAKIVKPSIGCLDERELSWMIAGTFHL
jgi:hypothetical protein